MRLLVVLLLGACAIPEGSIDQSPCVDVDLSDPGDPELRMSAIDGGFSIVRTNAFHGNRDIFRARLQTEGRRMFVREYWDEDADSTGELCWFLELDLLNAPGRWTVEWYEGDDVVPLIRQEWKP
jgi:hypothetical protein